MIKSFDDKMFMKLTTGDNFSKPFSLSHCVQIQISYNVCTHQSVQA
jgi:hypothetical protein